MRPPKVSAVVQVPQIARVHKTENKNTFIIPVQIQIDGLGLSTEALCDTGADIELSISPKMAAKAIKHLGAKKKRKDQPVELADYRQEPCGKATHELMASFEIDGRRFQNQSFLIINTGYDIFVGQDWLAKQDVWLHPKTKTFLWPESKPALAKYALLFA